jgi:cytochrome b involved in lipid metabolism
MANMINRSEVSVHCHENDCWIIINGKVYNVTAFLNEHPGGPEIIQELAGKDATEDFMDTGHSPVAHSTLNKFYVGLAEGDVPVPVEQKIRPDTPSIYPSIIILLIVILLGVYLNTDI